MRPIKFRAWDKEKKEMISWYEAHYKGACGWRNDETWNHIVLWNELHELMQFTWLLDQNGKEIYEGDIALIFWHPAYVEFSPKWYGYVWINKELPDQLRELPFYDWEKINFPEMEIIWSIYENPDLLSPQK